MASRHGQGSSSLSWNTLANRAGDFSGHPKSRSMVKKRRTQVWGPSVGHSAHSRTDFIYELRYLGTALKKLKNKCNGDNETCRGSFRRSCKRPNQAYTTFSE